MKTRPTAVEVRAALNFYNPDPNFGRELRRVRTEVLKWTQLELAFALRVDPAQICGWENGAACQSQREIKEHLKTITAMIEESEGKESTEG